MPEAPEHDLRLAWADWLRSFRWDYFVTPTFKRVVTEVYARRVTSGWLQRLTPKVYAMIAYEHGDIGGRTHVHALVGGLGRHPFQRTRLQRSWRYGIIDVSEYDPTLDPIGTCRGASWYVAAKTDYLDPSVGSPVKWRPRKRGGRARHT